MKKTRCSKRYEAGFFRIDSGMALALVGLLVAAVAIYKDQTRAPPPPLITTERPVPPPEEVAPVQPEIFYTPELPAEEEIPPENTTEAPEIEESVELLPVLLSLPQPDGSNYVILSTVNKITNTATGDISYTLSLPDANTGKTADVNLTPTQAQAILDESNEALAATRNVEK